MSFPRTSLLLGTVAAGCLCVPGCGGGDEGSQGGPGAPIEVPSVRTAVPGKPLKEVQPALVGEIRRSCGGRVCVNIVNKHVARADAPPESPPGDDPGYCEYRRMEPPPGALIKPGDTIYLIAGTEDPKPCGVPETVTAEPIAPTGDRAPGRTEKTPTVEKPTGETPTDDVTPTGGPVPPDPTVDEPPGPGPGPGDGGPDDGGPQPDEPPGGGDGPEQPPAS